MNDVKRVPDAVPDHVLSLLGQVLDGFRRDLGRQGRLPAGLRTSQVRLLSLTPVEGMRVTELADRVGMTKQALGEFANALEERGMLESLRDPADGRVRILRPTPAGRRVVRSAERQIAAVEAAWRERLGPRKWDQLRALLLEAALLSP